MTTSRRPPTLETIDIQRLMQLLPHRYPFLLVDRIIEARGDEFGIGIKNVTINEPHFQGHFPGQAGDARRAADRSHGADRGRALRPRAGGRAKPQLVYFMTIDKAKFRKPVIPGDRVEFHMTKHRTSAAISGGIRARRRSTAYSSPRRRSAP